MIHDEVLKQLEKYTNPGDSEFLAHFFKTGEGQYGAGDHFIGVRVPDTRIVAKQFADISLEDIEILLESPIHEMRLCAVIIMANRSIKNKSDEDHKALFDLYLRRTDRINNWDLVDVSCRDVVGGYIMKHPEKQNVLTRLAKSSDLWERRIAMVSTWQFIRDGKLDLTFKVAELLLHDKQDLIHKAVGWMLREAGKKDADRLRHFLTTHITKMPRTSLRYAIEHFDPDERKYFLQLR